MTARYRSPLRPLDMGYVERLTGIAPDWDATTIGPMLPETLRTRVYAFVAPLPAELVEQFGLELAP